MFNDYYAVREWLESFIPLVYRKEELGLSRIEYLLKLLGNPQNKFKSIHVAGTSGKGSTAFYTAKLLQESGRLAAIKKRSANLENDSGSKFSPRSGLRPASDLGSDIGLSAGLRHVFDWWQASRFMPDVKIGLHVSPHLIDIRERMQINSRLIPRNRFIRLMSEIRTVVKKIQKTKPELAPSYFEILVAASFLYFAQEKVDWAVVEVGLGGRLDATNVLRPKVSVITNIGLDHTEILGKTIEEIAFEKAGIIKRNTPVVTGTTGKALEVIEKVAKEKKAPLIKIDTRLGVELLKFDIFRDIAKPIDIFKLIPKNLVFSNVLLALAVVRAVNVSLNSRAIVEVFNTGFPGRFEEIAGGVILDGAHNPDKVRFLIDFVRNSKFPTSRLLRRSSCEGRARLRRASEIRNLKFKDVTLVIAFKKGKDWKKMIDLLLNNLPIKKVIATQFYAVTDTGPPRLARLDSAERASGKAGRFAAVKPEEIKEYLISNFPSFASPPPKQLRRPSKTSPGEQLPISNVKCFDNSQEAVFEALNSLGVKLVHPRCVSGRHLRENLVLVTGSLYLVGEVRTMWKLPKF